MSVLNGLLYSKDHEWLKVEGTKAYIGITDHAQEALGGIVFVELPQLGDTLSKGDAIGVIESVKAASDVYTPVSGIVVEINQVLVDEPEKLNDEPYKSWLAILELKDIDELQELMESNEYERYLSEEV